MTPDNAQTSNMATGEAENILENFFDSDNFNEILYMPEEKGGEIDEASEKICVNVMVFSISMVLVITFHGRLYSLLI